MFLFFFYEFANFLKDFLNNSSNNAELASDIHLSKNENLIGSTTGNLTNSNIVPSEAIPIPLSSDYENRSDVDVDSATGNFCDILLLL